MADIIYGKAPYAYVWADNNGTHKHGKVFPDQGLVVSAEKGNGYWIERPVLDREVDPRYAAMGFWIFKDDVVLSHGSDPEPPVIVDPAPESDLDVAMAIVTLIRWIKSL